MAEETPVTDLGQWLNNNVNVYGNSYATAYQALGQPTSADPNGIAPFAINTDADRNKDTRRQVIEGMSSIADPFVKEFSKSNGRPPTELELNTFMSENLTPNFALEHIQGKLTPTVVGNRVREYIKTNIDSAKNDQAQKDYLQSSLQDSQTSYDNQNKLIEQQAQEAGRSATVQAQDVYGQELRRQAIENAQMGRLPQPVYQENVNRQSQAFGKGLAGAIANIQGQKLQAQSTANQSLMDRLQGNKQFAANLGISQQGLNLTKRGQDLGQQNLQNQTIMDMIQNQQNRADAYEFARRQAEASKPGTLDYINTGFQGLNALVGVGGALKSLNKGPQADYAKPR